MGAGLGGGSSNAATTLIVLNQLWQCGLNTEQLAALGVTTWVQMFQSLYMV